jgi:RimK family alpha-L-glutamate ligase
MKIGLQAAEYPNEMSIDKSLFSIYDGLKKQGNEVTIYKPEDMYIYGEDVYAKTKKEDVNLSDYDIIHPRAMTWERSFDGITHTLNCLDLLEENTNVVNNSNSIYKATDKAKLTDLYKKGYPVPKSVYTSDSDVAYSALEEFGNAVIKPRFGSFGDDVLKLDRYSVESKSIIELFLNAHDVACVQEFLNGEGCKRIHIIDDEIFGAYNRLPSPGDWRENVSKGGDVERTELTEYEKDLALKTSEEFGLSISGADTIGDYLIELNFTPGIMGLINLDIKSEDGLTYPEKLNDFFKKI